MAPRMTHRAAWLACLLSLLAVDAGRVGAQAAGPAAPVSAGRPVALPYFASLKRPVANVRVGPGRDYPIRWVYKKRGLPVEVLASYGNWRRIRASDGSEGWIAAMLLSSRRTALVAPWSESAVDLRAGRRPTSAVAARLQPRVLVGLQWCDRMWCSVRVQGQEASGYVRQTRLWGVYPDETIPDRSVWGVMRNML
ncbi:hypothetical protein C4E04_13070 [Microvirga sp. 17 mud 1-3]|nr:hypothetical protein C4E04_13070 [Microvirga sp. 17 mud 1-3]